MRSSSGSGPLPLQRRLASSVAELERIFGTEVQLVEVSTVTELAIAVGAPGVVAVAVDAPQPGAFTEAVAAAGSLPVLQAIWRRQRNTREVRSTRYSTGTGSSRQRTS